MRRRAFIAGLSSEVARWLLSAMPAVAQQKIARIGVLTPGGSDRTPSVEAFRKGLQELGYIEGRSIILDFRFAKGHNEALPRLAAELVKIPVDVIVAGGTTAVQAAAQVTRSIPIIQAAGGDPVSAGLAASLAHPGGNVTGFTIRANEPSGKRVELLKRAFPGITLVTVLLDPTSIATQPQLRATEEVADALGLRLQLLSAGTPEELDALDPAALAGSEGLVVLPNGMFWDRRATIVALAAAARVPAIYPSRIRRRRRAHCVRS
jgi:putative ABC transport system substrate-binding protein